jgi:hypothetical protein
MHRLRGSVAAGILALSVMLSADSILKQADPRVLKSGATTDLNTNSEIADANGHSNPDAVRPAYAAGCEYQSWCSFEEDAMMCDTLSNHVPCYL